MLIVQWVQQCGISCVVHPVCGTSSVVYPVWYPSCQQPVPRFLWFSDTTKRTRGKNRERELWQKRRDQIGSLSRRISRYWDVWEVGISQVFQIFKIFSPQRFQGVGTQRGSSAKIKHTPALFYLTAVGYILDIWDIQKLQIIWIWCQRIYDYYLEYVHCQEEGCIGLCIPDDLEIFGG